MNRRASIIVGLLVIAAVVSTHLLRRPADPLFENRSTSVWVRDFIEGETNAPKARGALLQIGTPAAAHLARALKPDVLELIPARLARRFTRFDPERAGLRRKRALEALAALGPAAAPAAPDLVGLLGTPSEQVASDVAHALRRIGTASASELRKALRHDAEIVRVRAAQYLRDFHPPADETIAALTQSISDQSAAVRASAIQSLGLLAPETTAATTLALNDDFPLVRARACEALGRTLAKQHPTQLLVLMRDKDPGVRFEAANAIWHRTGDAHQSLPIFIELLNSTESWRAAQALGEMGDQAASAVPALLLAMRREQVPRPFRSPATVTYTLGKIHAATPALADALRDEQPLLRINAAMALGFLEEAATAAIPSLLLTLRDPENDVRLAAALALGQIGSTDPRAISALEKCLTAEDIFIRGRALDLLRKVAPGREYAAASE